jgi:hypothetical protein
MKTIITALTTLNDLSAILALLGITDLYLTLHGEFITATLTAGLQGTISGEGKTVHEAIANTVTQVCASKDFWS